MSTDLESAIFLVGGEDQFISLLTEEQHLPFIISLAYPEFLKLTPAGKETLGKDLRTWQLIFEAVDIPSFDLVRQREFSTL